MKSSFLILCGKSVSQSLNNSERNGSSLQRWMMAFSILGTNFQLKNSAADLLPSRDQGDSEQRRSDLLLHIHQLEQAIRLLHNLAHLDIIQVEDSQLLSDVSNAFREVYQELNHQYAKVNLNKEQNMGVVKSTHPNVVLSAFGRFC